MAAQRTALLAWAVGAAFIPALALVGFFFLVPMVALGPFVGVLVDRSNRRLMMMLSDLAAAFITVIALTLYATDNLQIWHLYVAATISGTFQGFQWPAYSAAITLMLLKEQYARANGMLEMDGNASCVFAPLLAGALIGPLGLAGILIIDLVSVGVAVGTLLFVHIPQPPRTEAGREGAGSFLKETAYGLRYILARPSLLGLQTVFMVGNFFLYYHYLHLCLRLHFRLPLSSQQLNLARHSTAQQRFLISLFSVSVREQALTGCIQNSSILGQTARMGLDFWLNI